MSKLDGLLIELLQNKTYTLNMAGTSIFMFRDISNTFGLYQLDIYQKNGLIYFEKATIQRQEIPNFLNLLCELNSEKSSRSWKKQYPDELIRIEHLLSTIIDNGFVDSRYRIKKNQNNIEINDFLLGKKNTITISPPTDYFTGAYVLECIFFISQTEPDIKIKKYLPPEKSNFVVPETIPLEIPDSSSYDSVVEYLRVSATKEIVSKILEIELNEELDNKPFLKSNKI